LCDIVTRNSKTYHDREYWRLLGGPFDMRDINTAVAQGSRRALLARQKFIYDIKRYIGEFLVLMEGLEVITFTGGIGQQDADLRQQVLSSLSFLGLELDSAANERHEKVISTANSRIKVLVLETNEEIVVARETVRVIRGDRHEQNYRH